MSLSVETLAVAKKYTDDSLAGAGAVAGVPCQIQSKTAITGGTRITFLWVDNNGDSHTTAMDVMNGIDGQDGKGIQSVSVNENNHLIITYSDGTTDDAGQIEIHSAVDSVNGQTGNVTLDAEDVGALPDDTPIPSKTSDLTNDSGFITKAVNDLVSYYLKSETYSKTEVDSIATAIKNSRFEVVATLPTTDIKTNVIYLVPKSPSQTSNVKDEYINLDGTTAGWEKIGDTEIDLSDYVTTQALNTALADYTTTDDLTTLLAAKQDTLTFDDVPTENSNNPVKSGGVYSANQNIYEVMGQMGTKNLITYPHSGKTETKAGITFTENADGSVTVNGTATEIVRHLISSQQFEVGKKYILSGCPSGGSHSLNGTYTLYTQTVQNYDDGEGVEFTWDASITGITIAVFAGITVDNLTFYPMIRLASDTDNTYQPYAKTNQELTVETQALTNQTNGIVNVLGAKNVLPFPYYEGSGTYNGVTITDNGDGSITLDGTCTGMSFFVFYGGRYSLAPTTFVKKNEDYIATLEVVSGSMAINSGTSRFVFRNYITNATSPFVDIFYEDNVIDTRSVKFTYEPTASYDTSLVWYEFNVGTTFNNWRIRPMIRLASITDDTYVPYAKTNQQLTEDSIDWDNFSELGAVNMLPNTATTQTINGVTFTVNSDGTVTANGTATANAVLKISDRFTLADYIGRKYVDAKKNEASSSTYSLIITYRDGSGAYVNETYVPTEGFILSTISNATLVEFGVFVKSGQSVSNLTFKPMITVASYNGDYVPYAKNNRELTTSATTNAKNISTINKGTFDIDAIELTANTPKKVISSYGVYLITFNHGGGAPGGLYLVQVHATDVNGMQVAVIKESTDRTVSFDLTVVNQLTVTASGNGRMRIIKLDASNY